MSPGYQFDVNGSIRYSNQLASTVGSGTAPLDVVSTTLCVNLNADLLDGQHGAFYLDRGNHTSSQAISTVTGLQSALDGKETAFSKGSLIQGSGVTLSGTLSNRLVGSGDVTISASLPGGLVTGSGTITRMALWTSSSTIAASGCLIEIGGFQITIAGNLVVEGSFLPPIGALPGSGTAGEFRYNDSDDRWYGWNGTEWLKFGFDIL
jgi:hypothetical protein